MESPASINKDSVIDPGQSFNYLLKVALEKIQHLAGDTWTDYNEHDPGITILEQLAYALTELGSKAALPIKDLICKENGSIDGLENIFFTAAEILTSSPVTLKDYRKLLIDTFQEINNVWIGFDEKGTYEVIVAMKSDLIKEKRDELEKGILSCLNQNRNLSESFNSVITLNPCKLGIQCSIQVADHVDIRSVVENVLVSLNELITPVVQSGTVPELFYAKQTSENIFSGPVVQYGYILDEDLHAKKTFVRVNDILRVIMSTAGVESVSTLNLLRTDPLSTDLNLKKIDIAVDELAIFDADYSLNNFALFVGKFQVFPPVKQMISDYYTRKHKNKTPFLTPVTKEMLDLPIPTGTCYNVREYYSIKNHFPYIYGLDYQYDASTKTPQRQSEVLQLKGYLSFFEQHMANSLAQLAGSATLLGLRSGSMAYFGQSILQYVGMNEILSHDYLDKLDSILNNPEKVNLRLNNVKNHVFSRFAEVVIPYQSVDQSGEISKDQAVRDLALIQALPEYSSRKAKAPQYIHEDGSSIQAEKNGLELKLETLLDLNSTDLNDKSVFIVDHLLLCSNSGLKNIEDNDFYTSRVSYVLLTEAKNVISEAYNNYVVETISRSCPAHLLCNVLLFDIASSDTAGEFRKLFLAWVKQSDRSVITEDQEDINFQLATFISKASDS